MAKRWLRRVAIAGAILFCILAGTVGWLTFRTYHFAAVQPGVLYRCGNRGVAEFSNAVGRLHPHLVISLVDDQERSDPNKPQFEREEQFLSSHHIPLQHIEVPLGGWPTSDQIQQFLDAVQTPANQPVLVHCAQGVRRTGMFVAAYQESGLGYDKQKAIDSIRAFGHSDRDIADIRKFIADYDPASRTVRIERSPTSNEQ